jgi:hypothetical protein
MAGGFQLTQCLEASTPLSLPPGIIEAKLFADPGRELTSVKNVVVLKQPANVCLARRL